MDIECAVCCSIKEAIDQLKMVSNHIDFTCQKKARKVEFGLHKSFVEKQINTLEKMQEWHNYYHATGKSLKDTLSNIDYPQEGPVFRRFRPPQ